MKNKLLLAGAIAAAGFIGLTAFGGTKAEQDAQIKAAVDAKLAAYTAELQAACDARVEAEAQTRYEAVVAERAAAEAAKPAAPGKKPATKPKGSKGPKVDPLPQATKPTDPQKTRGGAVQEGNTQQQKERSGATPEAPAGTAPAAQKKRGGAVKEGGGN